MALQKFSVARDDSFYHGWPDVVKTPSGKLVCCFSECAHHIDRTNARIMLTESYDRGRTWTAKHPLSEVSQKDFYFNCARLSTLPDGRIVCLCDRVDASAHGEHGPNTVQYVWIADPEGEAWSEPRILPFRGIVPDKYHVLKNGVHLVAAHDLGENGKLEQYCWRSEDGGKTWSERITIAADPRYNLCEVSVLELEDGLLVAFIRENSWQAWDCKKAVSHDWGKTWEGVYDAPIPGCQRPVSGLLNDGKTVMVTHRFMQGGRGWVGFWTQNVFAAFLPVEDAAKTQRSEQASRIFPLDFDRSPVSDLGYTGWVQFEDGEIYVVNYIVDDAPKGQIRGYSFRMEDVLLPE